MLRKRSNYPTKEKQYCNTTLVATNNLRTIYIIYLPLFIFNIQSSFYQILIIMYTSLKSQSLSCIRNNNSWSFSHKLKVAYLFPICFVQIFFPFFFTVFHLRVKNNLLSALTSCLDINKFRIFLGSSWVLGSTKNAPKYMLYF